jgi:hypothetical protein
LRGATNDPEKFSKGDVRLELEEPSRDDQGGWELESDRYSNKYIWRH